MFLSLNGHTLLNTAGRPGFLKPHAAVPPALKAGTAQLPSSARTARPRRGRAAHARGRRPRPDLGRRRSGWAPGRSPILGPGPVEPLTGGRETAHPPEPSVRACRRRVKPLLKNWRSLRGKGGWQQLSEGESAAGNQCALPSELGVCSRFLGKCSAAATRFDGCCSPALNIEAKLALKFHEHKDICPIPHSAVELMTGKHCAEVFRGDMVYFLNSKWYKSQIQVSIFTSFFSACIISTTSSVC